MTMALAVGFIANATEVEIEKVNSDWAKRAGTVTGEGSSGLKGMSMVGDFKTNAFGDIFFSYDFNTGESFDFAQYGDDSEKFYGVGQSDKSSGTPNFAMHKIDRDGNLIMTVWSDRGHFDKADSKIAATEDGGALLALKMRLADGKLDVDGKKTLLRLHTSTDKDYVYTIEEPELPIDQTIGFVYRGYLIKLDAEGKVVWRKDINADYTPVVANGAERKRGDMFSFKGLTMGSDGCYYLAGKFASPLTIEGASQVYEPRNIPEDWDYNYTSHAAGDLFVAKFDKNGNHQWTLRNQEGSYIYNEGIICMASDDTSLYLCGHMKGSKTEIQKTIIGGKTIEVPSDRTNLFYIKLNYLDNANATDLTVNIDYARVWEGKIDSFNQQQVKPMGVTVGDDEIVVLGAFKGAIVDPADETVLVTSPNKNLNSLIFTADKGTGAFKAACYSEDLTETEYAHVVGDSIYVSGYGFNKGYVIAFDKETLNFGKIYQAFQGSGPCNNQGSALVGNKIVMFNRIGKNTDVYGIGTVKPLSKWDVLVNGFTLSGVADNKPSGVESIEKESAFYAYGTAGAIHIMSEESNTVYVFNIAGQLVQTVNVEEGTTIVEMPQGFYVVNGRKVLVL